ncbi:MAG: NADP-specific glutamate dehydrogenase [Acidobacteria bacterium]|nr:NADP-specific glutamate dehydrogenase [Acidobacteriota bacterium]
MTMDLDRFMKGLKRRNPGESEFHQAVLEVASKVIPFINENPRYQRDGILERMTEADRVVIFRVSWEDDEGNVRANRGYRIQFNNSLGPYKGGLRFDKEVNLSIFKFLGFEQVFKNSLTTLPMGGAKGGSDFNPKGKSDREVMRFCQSFMTELYRHIGEDTDVPAGDIGVGGREIGFLFGQFKRLTNKFTGAMTGKGIEWGGSLIRTEATGYGCIYFAREMLGRVGEGLEGKRCVISGSGNVAQYAAAKLIELGARVITISDRHGFVYDPNGIDEEKLSFVITLKTDRRGSLATFASEYGLEYHEGKKPWIVDCDLAFPCATQNEIEEEDARALVSGGCRLVAEGANMPTTMAGAKIFEAAKVLYAPSKAANAGGVAISGLEMTQNAIRLKWSREEVDERLQRIMVRIHEQCVLYGANGETTDYVKGANIGGFVKVADAMLAYGVV